MSLKSRLLASANALLAPAKLEILRTTEATALRSLAAERGKPTFNHSPLPAGAAEYLRPDNRRLVALKAKAGAASHPASQHSQWTDRYVAEEVDLRYFRGDNAYVWQHRDMNTGGTCVLTAHHVESFDRFGLLRRLKEDDLFGAYVYPFRDLVVSRDLLDSIVEAYFLDRHLGLSERRDASVLDIGAGYGRLAHRLVDAFANIGRYICVDAVPESTFVSEYYLRFRGVNGRASVVPLGDIEATLAGRTVDLAVNIHSFSECSLAAIDWWLSLLARHGVRHLLIVPNADEHGGTKLVSRERDGTRLDVLPSITASGYRLVVREPKFLDPDIQRYGISPTYHYLFERSSDT